MPTLSAPQTVAAPASEGGRRVFRVSAVVGRADEVLREKAPPLWVRGEVSGWKRMPSGHCYFTLKDEQAELSCVLWAAGARALPMLPDNGMEVDVHGQLGIYARRGQFRMEVTRIEATGAGGMWRLAMERLVERLRGEGLLDEARKRPLPAFPERVGIVTSAESAALHDMLRALRRKAWWMPTLVSHSGVEGPASAPEIAAAIRRFGATREGCPVDVVIVARGGGSMESLWGFNMEPVARALAACPVPVISAVGHETDYTVADMVADVRAATPTAGAERAVPDGLQVLDYLRAYPRDLGERAGRRLLRGGAELEARHRELEAAVGRRLAALEGRLQGEQLLLEARSPRRRLDHAAAEVERLSAGLHAAAAQRLGRLELALAGAAEGLEARSPLRVLARGYAVVSDPVSGRVVRAPDEVSPGQRLRVRLARGEIGVRAEPLSSPTP